MATLALIVLGVVVVYSSVAGLNEPGNWYSRKEVRQAIYAACAMLVLAIFWRIDYRILAAGRRFPTVAGVLLGVSLALGLLVFVPGIGKEVGGYYRWIRLGPARYGMQFQPSEIIKILLVVFLSAWLTRPNCEVTSFRKTFLPAMLLIGLCLALVIKEDFGTSVVIGLGATATLFLAGVPVTQLLALVPLGGAAIYFLVIKNEYRYARITAFMDPWSTTNPTSYQPMQSLLSILSGGMTGKGLGNGTLKLGYLPEGETDFVFSVFCEEWGMVGAALLMGMLILWMWHARKAAIQSDDRFGKVLAGSLGFVVATQAILHIAVNLVAIPTTGVALPFISVGGTSLLIVATAVAIMISVSAHRWKNPPELIGWADRS